jgi:hypothetical protein
MQALAEQSLSGILDRLADGILKRNPSLIRDLRIERVTHGIILHGVAKCYYGVQVVLQEIRQRYPVRVVENRVLVEQETISNLAELQSADTEMK